MMNNILIIVILIGLIDITISLNKNIIKKGLSIGTSILLSSMPVNAKVIGEIGTSGIVFKGYHSLLS